MKPWILTALATVLLGGGVIATFASDHPEEVMVKKPFDASQAKKGGGSGGNAGILYHGGAVLLQTVPLYVIYYGTFTVPTTQPIVNAFLGGLSNTPQYGVNKTYDDSTGTFISGYLSFSAPGNIFEDTGASQGTQIGTSTVLKIIEHAIDASTSLHLPADSSAVYIVITAPDIKVSGFCKSFCAYHSSSTTIASVNGTAIPIRYALVPDPSQRCTGCDGNFAMKETATPNGDAGADEMVDSIMHEVSESVTDPDGKSWFTSSGEEDGDLCNYVYGSNLPKVNGASYNAAWGSYFYLIQEIWKYNIVPAKQACSAN